PRRARCRWRGEDLPAMMAADREWHDAIVPATRPELRTLTVCVDDFGLHQGINAAALRLVQMGRVSALSAMTQAPEWPRGASSARELDADQVDVGLHFNLTLPFRGSPALGSMQALIAAAHLRMLPKRRIREALLRQLTAFEDEMFRAPAHVDGHEHVHLLPVIRDILLDVLVQRYRSTLPWLRVCASPAPASSIDAAVRFHGRKAWFIDRSQGGEGFRHRARALGFTVKHRWLGVHGTQASASEYRALLLLWLNNALDGDVLVCHPGHSGTDDLVDRARRVEFAVWADPLLGCVLQGLGIRIASMSDGYRHVGEIRSASSARTGDWLAGRKDDLCS
ncbi:ChbG/HpnK family deacetylase, partial [Variovorax sp. RHLX14]